MQMPHLPAPLPANEQERIRSLEHLGILDSAPEPGFDDIVLLATSLCDLPIALVSLIDNERQFADDPPARAPASGGRAFQ